MWIKRKGSRSVNTDHVQYIEPGKWIDSHQKEEYYIRFIMMKDSLSFSFANEKERDEYFDSLMDKIGAEEVPLLKIQ